MVLHEIDDAKSVTRKKKKIHQARKLTTCKTRFNVNHHNRGHATTGDGNVGATKWKKKKKTIIIKKKILISRRGVSARGKKDKYAGPLLMGAMMVAGTLLPIKLGALAMMSGKALMTSMLALMLSAILALKKLASGGGSHSGTTYEVINVPSPAGHGPHGRSLAHNLAYGLPVASTTATGAARR